MRNSEPFGDEQERFLAASPHPSIVDMASIQDPKQRTGVGFMVYRVGTIYEGEWLNGDRHGHGICFFNTGNIYIGNFVHGAMEGEGTMLFPTGGYFSGEFRQSNFFNGYTIFGAEVRSLYRGGVEHVIKPPNQLADQLQRAHTELFSTLMKNVGEYFRMYAPTVAAGGMASVPSHMQREPSHFNQVLSAPAPAVEVPLLKFGDNYFASSPRRRNTDFSPRLGGEELDMTQNMSFASARLPLGSDGETEKAAVSPPLNTHYTSSRPAIFACSTPANNDSLSLSRFWRCLAVFLFPFLSLPWAPIAPFRITSLKLEREFVVSGATLRRDFDPPSHSIYVIAVAVCCQVTAIVLVACKVSLGSAQQGKLTLPEMVVPCVLWLLVALCSAVYHSYERVPHCLERMDRRLTPKLSAFAANVVDSRAAVCIFTWDEEGRCKVMNPHYRYRWAGFSIIFGAMMSLSAPSTRGGFGHPMYGRKGFEMAAALLAFFATFFFSSLLSYQILKMTDMQREVQAKLTVLSHLAVIEHRSVCCPSLYLKRSFLLDEDVECSDLFHGFSGWYVTRSLIMYASTSSNHNARSSCMSFFVLAMFSSFVVAIADVFYMLANHYDRSTHYYSTAHSYGVFVVLFWGVLLFRYLYVCSGTVNEEKRHLFIMDAAGLHHLISRNDSESHKIIVALRSSAAANEVHPHIFGFPVYPLVSMILVFLNLAALAAIAFQLGEVIYY